MDNSNSDRNSQLVVLFKEGKTLQEIGDMYGYTREYIRQLLKQCGVTGKDGGLRVRMTKQKCKVEGCAVAGKYTQGYCRKHYAKLLYHGDPLKITRFVHDAGCIVEGCDKPFKARGMCYNHYMSFTAYRRRGTPMELEEYLNLQRKKAKSNGQI